MSRRTYEDRIVTPQIAAEYLALSRGNRHTSDAIVRQLAALILAGQWVSDLGDAVAFDSSGRFANGHHRMLAIVRAGVPVVCRVEPCISEEHLALLDQVGRTRSGRDVVTMVDCDPLASRRAPILTALLRVGMRNSAALTAPLYRHMLPLVGVEHVDAATIAKRGRGVQLRAAFAWARPAMGTQADRVWAQLMADGEIPAASTVYRVLAIPPRNGNDDGFRRTINGLRHMAAGHSMIGLLRGSDDADAWASAARGGLTIESLVRP